MKGNGEECTKEPTCDRHKEVLQGKFILRRREKKDQEGHQKIASPPKVQILCRLILVWSVVVSFWQRLLQVDSFSFWQAFRLSHLGTATFEPSLKQATQK